MKIGFVRTDEVKAISVPKGYVTKPDSASAAVVASKAGQASAHQDSLRNKIIYARHVRSS